MKLFYFSNLVRNSLVKIFKFIFNSILEFKHSIKIKILFLSWIKCPSFDFKSCLKSNKGDLILFKQKFPPLIMNPRKNFDTVKLCLKT